MSPTLLLLISLQGLSITSTLMSSCGLYFLTVLLLLETLLLAVFLMLDVLLLDIFFESILPLLYTLISLCRFTGKFRASFSIFLYTLFGLFFVLFSITGDPAQEILDELFTSFELSHGYSMYLSFAPLITYSNPEAQKLQIIKENKGKSGVYR
jgi:NADH:ubiquinone oxidoreductase subunit 4 (subunit M)